VTGPNGKMDLRIEDGRIIVVRHCWPPVMANAGRRNCLVGGDSHDSTRLATGGTCGIYFFEEEESTMYNKDKRNGGGQPYCEYCGKSKDKVKVLVAGPGIFICDECVAMCQSIVSKELHKTEQQNVT
jgi:hypothetical protein